MLRQLVLCVLAVQALGDGYATKGNNEQPYWWMEAGSFGHGQASQQTNNYQPPNQQQQQPHSQQRLGCASGLQCVPMHLCQSIQSIDPNQVSGDICATKNGITFVCCNDQHDDPWVQQRPNQIPQQPYQPPTQQNRPAPQQPYQQHQQNRPAPQQPYQPPNQQEQYQQPNQQHQQNRPQPQRPFQQNRPQGPPNTTFRPYTGPTRPATPFPGCPAAMLCVQYQMCNATGFIMKQPNSADSLIEDRVQLTTCSDFDNGLDFGYCCRDPDYVDPWPGGMMMMGPNNQGQAFKPQGQTQHKPLQVQRPQQPYQPPQPKPQPQQPYQPPQHKPQPQQPYQPPQPKPQPQQPYQPPQHKPQTQQPYQPPQPKPQTQQPYQPPQSKPQPQRPYQPPQQTQPRPQRPFRPPQGRPQLQGPPNTTFRPYTGPTRPATPYPGCPAAMLCVPYEMCNATGMIMKQPNPADLLIEDRVSLVTCSDFENGLDFGYCCRDPDYVDPWPGGMMMMGSNNKPQSQSHVKPQIQPNPQPQQAYQPPQPQQPKPKPQPQQPYQPPQPQQPKPQPQQPYQPPQPQPPKPKPQPPKPKPQTLQPKPQEPYQPPLSKPQPAEKPYKPQRPQTGSQLRPQPQPQRPQPQRPQPQRPQPQRPQGPNTTFRPYTGPTAPARPFPGCSAGLLCVPANLCSAKGVIKDVVDPVDELTDHRVSVTECSDPDTNLAQGVCCRDPNYVDPWPPGMMMNMGTVNKGQQVAPQRRPRPRPTRRPVTRYTGPPTTFKPYTGPTRPALPFPGCSAGMVCVPENMCSAIGWILKQPDPEDQANGHRVSLISCTDAPSGLALGVCCRDPDYVDPWPGGMMNMGTGNKGQGQLPQPQKPQTQPIRPQPPKPRPQPQPIRPIPQPVQPQPPRPQPPRPQPQPTRPIPQPVRPVEPQPTQCSPGYQCLPTEVCDQAAFNSIDIRNKPSEFCIQADGVSKGWCCNPPQVPVRPQAQPQTCTKGHGCVRPGQCTTRVASDRFGNDMQCDHIPGSIGVCCLVTRPPVNVPDVCGISRPQPGQTAPYQARYGEYPWQVTIFNQRQQFQCGGTLVAKSHVITSAQCLANLQARDLTVRVGEYNLAENSEPHQDVGCSNIYVHPDYVAGPQRSDIAILELSRSVELGPAVGTACLPQYDQDFNGMTCTASGFGPSALSGYEQVMRRVNLPIVDVEWCEIELSDTEVGPNYKLDQSFICAGGDGNADSCEIDNGGPLVCNIDNRFVLAGVASWNNECGKENIPQVYTNVAKHTTWISNIIDPPMQFAV